MSSGLERCNSESPLEDPLGIDKLSVDYDYLIYRIQDYVESIGLETTRICERQNKLITEDIVAQEIDHNIQEFKRLLEKCDALENHFDMLNEIAIITESFKERLDQVVKDYKSLS